MSANKRLQGLFLLAYILTCTLLMSSCIKDPTLPVVNTGEAVQVTINSAEVGGIIIDDGGAEITARGFCWSKASAPSIMMK